MAYTVGANDWLLSTYVNLLAAGVSASTAKAFVLTMVTSDQGTDLAAVIDDQAADCLSIAHDAYDDRTPADGWNYITSSPMQTYEHL